MKRKIQLFSLLMEYNSLFAASTFDLGRTDHIQHHINTGSNPPVRQRVHRIPERGSTGVAGRDEQEGCGSEIDQSMGFPHCPHAEKIWAAMLLHVLPEGKLHHEEG